MIVLPHYDSYIYFDVDDTLIEWVHCTAKVCEERKDELLELNDSVLNSSYCYLPKKNVIEYLIECKSKGSAVIVWSQGGYNWCEKVVKALNIEQYVDVCLTKPDEYVDDLHSSVWLSNNWNKIPLDNT